MGGKKSWLAAILYPERKIYLKTNLAHKSFRPFFIITYLFQCILKLHQLLQQTSRKRDKGSRSTLLMGLEKNGEKGEKGEKKRKYSEVLLFSPSQPLTHFNHRHWTPCSDPLSTGDLIALCSPAIPGSQLISEPKWPLARALSPCTTDSPCVPETRSDWPQTQPWQQKIRSRAEELRQGNLGSFSLPERWSWAFIPFPLVASFNQDDSASQGRGCSHRGNSWLQPGNVGFVSSNSICRELVNNSWDDERSHQLLALK